MFETEDARHRWLSVGLLVVVAAVYARAVTFGHQMGFDDLNYLFHRPEVRNWWGVNWRQRLTTPEAGYWIPVPTVIYAHLRTAFPDLYVHVVHGANIAIHVLNVGLVYTLASRWSDDRTTGLVVAAVWGLHPIHVESVAWLTSMKVLLFGTGMLAALVAWDKHLDDEGLFARGWVTGPAVLAAFVMALGCKPEAVILPILIASVTWYRRREWSMPRAGYVLIAVQLGITAAYVPMVVAGQDAVVTGLHAPYLSWRWFGRIFRAVEISLRNYLVPVELGPGYFARSEISFLRMLPGIAVSLGVIVLGIALALRRQWRLVFGLAFGMVAYLPYAQIKPIPRLAADNYLYLPAVGATAFLVWAVAGWQRARGGREPRRWVAVAGVGLIVALLGLKTFAQVDRWRNPVELWKPVLVDSPAAWRPYSHLAEGYKEQGEWKKAASVLNMGLPYFRASGVYPAFMPLVFERLGRPEKAWRLAAEAAARHRDPKATHYEIYLGLPARHGLELPETEEVERITERAIEVVTSSDVWMSKPSHRVPLAQYFVGQDRAEWALPFLRREFEARRPHCAAWLAHRRMPREVAEQLEPVPELPDRCRSGSR